MDRKTFWIGILSLSAAVLLAANWFVPTPVIAETVNDGRDYQLITARIQRGGDALYVVDNRTGQMAVFIYDPVVRGLRPQTVKAVADAFAPGR